LYDHYEGYQNVVKYANLKYAIINTIRNPEPIFENVIKRHFYYKRDEIIAQC
jgi:hypothetical protein